jgi:regulator of RNase E activity RraA
MPISPTHGSRRGLHACAFNLAQGKLLCGRLNAVSVPHVDTWILEHEEVAQADPPGRLLVVDSFAQLKEHF